MADLSEVLQAFVTLITGVVYPNGTTEPSIVAPSPVKVYYGWPLPSTLDVDLTAPTNPPVNISVFNLPGDQDVTRFTRTQDPPLVPVLPTLTATVSGATVTIGGAVTAGNYISVGAGNQVVSYGAQPGDTLTSIAAALCSQFILPVVASASESVITFSAGFSSIVARVAAPQTMTTEVERLRKRFQITIWSATDAMRNTLGSAIRPAIMATAALLLPDGTTARLWPISDNDDDNKDRANGFLRDMIYMVEYPTTIALPGYPVTAPSVTQLASIKYQLPTPAPSDWPTVSSPGYNTPATPPAPPQAPFTFAGLSVLMAPTVLTFNAVLPFDGYLIMVVSNDLPTTLPTDSGILWSNGGLLMVSSEGTSGGSPSWLSSIETSQPAFPGYVWLNGLVFAIS